jgi:hypothetical protein
MNAVQFFITDATVPRPSIILCTNSTVETIFVACWGKHEGVGPAPRKCALWARGV